MVRALAGDSTITSRRPPLPLAARLPAGRAFAGATRLCWHALHPLARYPYPALAMLNTVLCVLFQLPAPAPVFPARADLRAGARQARISPARLNHPAPAHNIT